MTSILEYNQDFYEDVPQLERRLRAEDIKPSKVIVDKKAQTAKIIGSGKLPYDVTLSSCTCADFAISRTPCKHMYRLAIELDLLPPLPSAEASAERTLIKNDIAMWTKEFRAGNVSPKKYVKIIKALMGK